VDALGEMVVPDHVGRPQVLVIDRVVLSNELERCLVAEVGALSFHFQMRLGK
jgi:hypothetical protein